MSGPALRYGGVTVRYYSVRSPAVESISFSIDAGEKVALLGLNGSGKTTLLMATVGLAPFEGDIDVCGVRLDKRSVAEVRASIGFLFNVPEDQLLFPRVVDDVAFGLARNKVPPAEALPMAIRALAALGVEDLADASVHELSHGQKQRVALAGALVADPPVLLLDEPSAGLDPRAKRKLADHLSGHCSTMLVATHDLDFARRLCKRCVLLERGRVAAASADIDEVARRWETP
jgi:cobalt/nickel transport system ATP-binding protein